MVTSYSDEVLTRRGPLDQWAEIAKQLPVRCPVRAPCAEPQLALGVGAIILHCPGVFIPAMVLRNLQISAEIRMRRADQRLGLGYSLRRGGTTTR